MMRHLSTNTLKSIVRLSAQFKQECESTAPAWYTLAELYKMEFQDTPSQVRLEKLVSGLANRQLAELQALMGVGRGDWQPWQWDEAYQDALESLETDAPEKVNGEVEYMVYNSALADYLLRAMKLLKIN